MPTQTEAIEVKVIYPSAGRPAERKFSPQVPVREVKSFAMGEFGLSEGPDPENTANQIVFFLFHDRTKVDNLDQPISAFRHGNQQELTFRLVREVIVG